MRPDEPTKARPSTKHCTIAQLATENPTDLATGAHRIHAAVSPPFCNLNHAPRSCHGAWQIHLTAAWFAMPETKSASRGPPAPSFVLVARGGGGSAGAHPRLNLGALPLVTLGFATALRSPPRGILVFRWAMGPLAQGATWEAWEKDRGDWELERVLR